MFHYISTEELWLRMVLGSFRWLGMLPMMLYMHIYYCTLHGLRAARFCDSVSAPAMRAFFADDYLLYKQAFVFSAYSLMALS